MAAGVAYVRLHILSVCTHYTSRERLKMQRDYTKEYMYPPPPEPKIVQCKDCMYWHQWEKWDIKTSSAVTYPYGWCSDAEEHTPITGSCEFGVDRND